MSTIKEKISAAALGKMPKGVLFGFIQTKFTNKAKFPVLMAIIKIDKAKDSFYLELRNDELKRCTKGTDKLSEFSDIAGTLEVKIKKRINAKELDVINLTIDLKEKKTKADIYFQPNEGAKDADGNLYPPFAFDTIEQVF